MIGLNNKYAVVPLNVPTDHANLWAGDVISLKNYHQAEMYFATGAAFTKTAAVTLHQGVSVADCATALGFTLYYETGMMLKYDAASTGVGAAAGETATGDTSGGIVVIVEDLNGILMGYKGDDITAFADNEGLTFSGGKTAVVDGVLYNEDIMVPRTAALNTFNVTAALDINKIYCIPVNSSMLNEGMDCIEVNMADCDQPSIMAAWAILSQPRYAGIPMPTAIYD